MDGLFLYMKNNRIIYKVSIVSILILMLISTMQINPKNEKKNNVGADTELDYTLRYKSDTHKFYKVQGESVEEMIDEELNNLGIELVSTSITFDGKDFKGFTLNNANIISTKSVALELIGNVNIQIKDGTTNKIKSSYISDATGYYGIKADGNILFTGNGKLEVESSNMEESGNKECNAIYASDSCYMDTSAETNITAHAYKHNGIGINVVGKIAVKSGNVIAQGSGQAIQCSSIEFYSGTESHTDVIFAATDIDCNNVEKYIFEKISNYKYMEIGIIYDYYLDYNFETGSLKKGYADKNKDEKEISFSDIPGLSISEEKDKNGANILIMDGFNFVTSCSYGLYIHNNDNNVLNGFKYTSSITIQNGSKNRIVTKRTQTTMNIPIFCLTNLKIGGEGDLEIIINNKDNINGDPIYAIRCGYTNVNNVNLEIIDTNICIKSWGPENDVAYYGISANECTCQNIVLNTNVIAPHIAFGISCKNYIVNGSIVNIDVKSENPSWGTGINSSNIRITNSNLKVKGRNQAFTSLPDLDSDGDYDYESAVLCTSKIYKPSIESYTESDLERYPTSPDYTSSKYVEIGKVPNYYYRYKDSKLYEVSKNSTETELNSSTWPKGCTVVDGKLQLNSFNFVTTAPKVIDIVNTDARVEVLGENNLGNVLRTEETNTICSEKNLTINGTGTLNLINKNNATCRGIYVDNNDDSAKLSVNNITLNSNIEGTKAKGIEANVLELNKATTDINVASSSSTANDCIGIYTSGEMSILNNSNITAKTANSEITGYGIYSGGIFNTSASTITARGKDGAIYLAIAGNDFDTSTVKGSNNYDGTDSIDVKLSNTNCTYQYVLIKYVKFISVDISWGKMDYKYTEGNWNSSNHTYALGTWAPISEGGDKITVNNNSNVSINANIKYIQETAYSSIIGTIKRDNGSSLENITSSQNIIKNGKLDALLVLNGSLSQGSNGVKIGEVTVTITE